MAQGALQSEDVATGHHVVTGEGVPEDVSHLAGGIEATAKICATDAARHDMKSRPLPGMPTAKAISSDS